MSPHQSFDDVMARLRVGDNEAATKVFQRFGGRLIELAQKQLKPQIRRKVDPEDVLQSAFRSFFVRQAAGEFQDLESWDSLWGALIVITLHKCVSRIRHFRRARRDIEREAGAPATAEPTNDPWEGLIPDREPTPEEAAILAETMEQLLTQFEGRNREALTHWLQGMPVPEISELVGCTERTVYRVLDRAKDLLGRMNEAES